MRTKTMNFDVPTVLIVDDTHTNLAHLFRLLKKNNFRVLIAESGSRALSQVQRLKPDIILLDVVMPGIDGFETCRLLKANPSSRDIPIIFLTALDEPVNKVTGFELGGVDYITKPIEEVEVLARLNTHLTIHRLQQRLKKQNEVLEERVNERTEELARANEQLQRANEELSRANRTLEEEMVRRKRHEQEKDNLFAMIRQQSDQLSALTNLLITAQQKQRRGLARGLDEQVKQNLKLAKSNLDFMHRILADHLKPKRCNIVEKTILNTQQILSRTQLYLQSIEVDSHTPEEKQLLESPLLKLSTREREVLQLLIDGKTYQQIGLIIGISHKSVSTYRSRIMKKLETDNMADTMKFAIKHGLTDVS